MKNIRCRVKVTMFTFEKFEEEDAPKDCVKYVDAIDEQYQIVCLTDEQYDFLMAKTDEEIATYGPDVRPDFNGLREDFTEIHNGIAAPMLEKMQRLFEEDGCAQIWIDEAMQRIAVSVHQDCFDDEEGNLFISNEPVYVKNGLIHNQMFGQDHIVLFFEPDNKSLIVIPDVHGRSFWKDAVAEYEDERIIFLGDYTDPYPHEGIAYYEGLQALADVIEFKKQHMENVTLLLGNHDLSYLDSRMPKCRHDYTNHDTIKKLLTESLHLFDIIKEMQIDGRRVLFSHAGILPQWLEENKDVLGEIPVGKEADVINDLFHQGKLYSALAEVSLLRGGRATAGSCVWADVVEHANGWNMLKDCYQVFGHTHQSDTLITDCFACLDCATAFELDEEFNFRKI